MRTSGRQRRRGFAPTARRQLARGCRNGDESWCGHPKKFVENFIKLLSGVELSKLLTCAIRIADLRPDWIWPKWTTPVTPTTSSIPSQWLGLENASSFSGPHGLAPDPQLQEAIIKPQLTKPSNKSTSRCSRWWFLQQVEVQLIFRQLPIEFLCAGPCTSSGRPSSASPS